MIHRVMEFNANLNEERRITISMEFERPREALIPLMFLPDVVSESIYVNILSVNDCYVMSLLS